MIDLNFLKGDCMAICSVVIRPIGLLEYLSIYCMVNTNLVSVKERE